MMPIIHALLIEDDPDDVLLVREALLGNALCQCAVEVASTLSQGLDRLERERFDIILLDLSLPDSQGIDTFVELLTSRSGTPIIVLTGLFDNAMALRMMRLGAQGYLVKGRDNLAMLPLAIQYAIEQFHLLQDAHLVSQWEQHMQDMGHLRASWPADDEGGLVRFGEDAAAWQHEYQMLVEHLSDVESAAVDAGLDRLTDALDAVQVSAADVLDLHLEVLAGLCELASLKQADRYVGAGQRALIALLGALVQRARTREQGERPHTL